MKNFARWVTGALLVTLSALLVVPVQAANTKATGVAYADPDFDSLSVAGTLLTSTITELNILDGVTATAAELNILDGVTATAAELNILDGVTATAAELNLADGSVAGTAVASKLLALGSNKNVDTLVIADSGLKLGSGAGTAVTSTAAELNILDGVTAASGDINLLAGITAGTVTASKVLAVGSGSALTGLRQTTSGQTSGFSPNATDSGTVYYVTGGGGITATLPTPATGIVFDFCNAVDQNLTVSASPDLLVVFNNASASTVAFSTSGEKIGGCIKAIGTGGYYLIMPSASNSLTITD